MEDKPVPHFEQVDLENVRAVFVRGRTHRPLLRIPFRDRAPGRTLCIVGQNPSHASKEHADKTVHYLERYVHERLPEYGAILMLNLYTRVDTRKKFEDVEHHQADRILRCAIRRHQEFLLVFGKLKNEGRYNFPSRFRELEPLFNGKNLLQFDLATDFPPHPGNPKILYRNLDVNLKPFSFPA